jgi:hypothetical protein
MERKIITYKDFQEIGGKNDYYLWHFLQKKQEDNSLTIWSSFKEKENQINQINNILSEFNIPYYESYVEDSIDFLNGIGFPYDKLWAPPQNNDLNVNRNYFFKPLLIGFNKYEKIFSTFDSCYCVEGIVEVIFKTNSDLFLNHRN